MSTAIRSVYVHAPFCARRCFYCDFAVTVDAGGDAGPWSEALEAEMRCIEGEGLFDLSPRLATLYVGGGTPSLLGSGAMAGLERALGPGRLSDPELEWTAEANPESFSPELADRWRRAGVNRVSLGVQSFHDQALRWMGRLHGVEGPARAVNAARKAGITNVSVDLIFGLPANLGRSWEVDLDRALAFEVPHISLYGLSVEPQTPLGRAVAEGRERAVDEERYREEFLLAAERLASAGYDHYEVSNFARDGLVSRHNSAYWDGRPYLGLGNGAHSYRHPLRRWNVRDWEAYRGAVVSGKSPEQGREELSAEATALERIWLGLRTRHGLARVELSPAALAMTSSWEQRGLAVSVDDRIRLTPLGWLELDRLAVDLDGVGAFAG